MYSQEIHQLKYDGVKNPSKNTREKIQTYRLTVAEKARENRPKKVQEQHIEEKMSKTTVKPHVGNQCPRA